MFKRRVSLVVLFSLVMLFSTGLMAGGAKAPLIPMKDFFRNPEKTAFQLSPDGNYLAFMKPWKNRMNIHVQKIGETKITRVTSAEKRGIMGYLWANNKRLVYAQDKGGDENFRGYAVNIDGSNFLELTPFEKVKVQLVDDLKNNPEDMLISMNKRDKRIFDVYRVNINTGKMKMIAQNPGNIQGWITDHDGKLRVATTTDGVNAGILYREKETDEFKKILTTSFKDTLNPLTFTYDNKYMYVTSNLNRDKQAIFKFDIAKGKLMKMIFEHPDVDVRSLIRSDKQKKLQGVVFSLAKRQYHFFDKGREKLQTYLESKLPGVDVVIVSFSRDEAKMLIRTFSDKTRGAYYYFNKATKELKKLEEVSPWLKAGQMADMKPIKYKSRDGLTIHGYLTLPKGVEAKNLPVVINPHGGPWARDFWGYNPEVQFLANRGYAVLQMNFRGSTTYGKAFWQASFKQWGKKMQDDITDGVKMLIKKGIANPKRIGIYGGSYGGYATLAGLAFTPDLYACGVDYVGVSSIFSWMKAFPPYWKPLLDMVYEMVGHPEKDKDLLKSASPLYHVDKIKVPMLVAQGKNDPRVPKAESDQLVDALKKRGIEVPYIVKDNEGHGFRNEENRFDFYRAMETFLAKHLGGRAEGKK
jgi:dipeptidyl aminopeptidase/acylaminoacyl peptidase